MDFILTKKDVQFFNELKISHEGIAIKDNATPRWKRPRILIQENEELSSKNARLMDSNRRLLSAVIGISLLGLAAVVLAISVIVLSGKS